MSVWKIAAAATVLAGLSATPAFADAARDAILADYAAQAAKADPAFKGFSAQRGQAIYTAKNASAKPDLDSCQSCHGEDPSKQGRNAKTGKVLDPMAVSTNPQRFTNKDDVEKWFGRNCKEVLGHDCSALEKGDYITFLSAR